jgi:DivIVA domain-containing protein
MELTSKVLRDAEFREKRGGYHPEDVDRLLEEVADGVDELNERLRQAIERAQRAEAAAAEAAESGGGGDESLRRTLVLAQRTADMAIKEARDQASNIVAEAEQKAKALQADSERKAKALQADSERKANALQADSERKAKALQDNAEQEARRAHDDAISDIRKDLISLESLRQRGQEEVDVLNRWVEEHRSHLAATMKEALAVVERASKLSPAPTSHPIDVSSRTPRERATGTSGNHSSTNHVSDASSDPPPSDPFPSNGPVIAGPVAEPKAAVEPDAPTHEETFEVPFGRTVGIDDNGRLNGGAPRLGGPFQADPPALDPEEQAIADFFDEDEDEDDFDNMDSRFGGRLRWRR